MKGSEVKRTIGQLYSQFHNERCSLVVSQNHTYRNIHPRLPVGTRKWRECVDNSDGEGEKEVRGGSRRCVDGVEVCG